MSTPRSPSIISLLASLNHSRPPVSDWLTGASDESEVVLLLDAVHGLPIGWLEWAESEIMKREKHNHPIHSKAGYAIATISNGITLLQESKFLCDVLENALRASVITYITFNKFTYKHLFPTNFLSKLRVADALKPADPCATILPNFIMEMNFGQLRRTIFLNWERIANAHSHRATGGFRTLFWSDPACRDVNLFNSDMDKIRRYRNRIAHSRDLFSTEDLYGLAKLVTRWLAPLDIELLKKVLEYRKNRPSFLRDLSI